MKYKKVILIVLGIIILNVVFIKMISPKYTVKVCKVSKGPLVATVFAQGVIVPFQQVNLASQTPGKIQYIVSEGMEVKAGDVVVKLDSKEMIAQKNQAEANFKSAKTNLESMKSLYKEKAVTKKKLEEAQTKYAVTKANFQLAQAGVSQMTTASPINGKVMEKKFSKGEMILPGALLVSIMDTSRLLVKANIDNVDIARVKEGQEAKITLDAFSDSPICGKINRVAGAAHFKESEASSFEALIELEKHSGNLKPGMSANVEIIVAKKQNVLRVPLEAVKEKERKKFIWQYSFGFASLKQVETGLSNDNFIEITAGVEAEKKIIKDAFSFNPPSDAKRVRVKVVK